ncbi:hypothetical protein ABNQ39_00440 (plasmid) [Azospirillum sp. A26]|uniref:hypothetical protein n=1 Tax=Azospirillum sp. A26 TaxID=3160607 RepID=UPI0036730D88
MSHDYRTQLTLLSETMASATGRSEARLATLAVNHGAFFDRIRGGGGCSVDMYLRVKEWFAENWPENVPWPDGVDRPDILPACAAAPRPGRASRRQPSHQGRAA